MKNRIPSVLTFMAALSAVVVLAASPLAHATTQNWNKVWTPDSVTACKRLPLSEWGICKAEVVAREQASAAAVQAPYPASYASAIAACGRLPLSERGICRAGAPMQAAQPMASATPTSPTLTAMTALDARYGKALRACQALPHSERTTCDSDAALTRQSLG